MVIFPIDLIPDSSMLSKSSFAGILMLLSVYAYAGDGNIVTGIVLDGGTGMPMELANVFAADTAGVVLATAFTHHDGRFNLRLGKPGDYNIIVSFIGYRSFIERICFDGQGIDLGQVFLEEGEEIEGATVNARQLLRKEIDRIVYDVSSDPDAYRMPMAEFMSKIPELERSPLHSGKIVYKDVPISTILIDNAENGLINVRRQYPMNFIQAAYMSRIELVLPGSPEYGNEEPILLITLGTPLPFGAAFKVDGKADTRGSYAAGADAVVNTAWFGIGLNYDFGYSWPKELTNTVEREMLDAESTYRTFKSSSSSRSKSLSHNLGMNIFRSFLDESMNVQLSLGTSKVDGTSYSRSSSSTLDFSGEEVRGTSSSSDSKSTSPMRFNAGFSLDHRWRDDNRYSFKYTYNDTRTDRNEYLLHLSNGTEERRLNVSGTGTKTHTALFDITLRDKARQPLWSLMAGIRYTGRHYFNSTDYQLYDLVTDSYVSDEARLDGMDYRQHIALARVSFSGTFMKRMFAYSLTLNAENVCNRGTYLATGSPLDYNEINVLPGAALMFMKNQHKISFRYSTSVRRPSMLQLDPYMDTSDPENIITGNPALKGEYTHRLNAEYSKSFKIKWFRSFSVSYSCYLTNNAIEAVTNVDGSNISISTFENIGRKSSQSVNAKLSFRPVKAISLNVSGGYNMTFFTSTSGMVNRIRYFDAMATGTFRFLGCFATAIFRLQPSLASAQVRAFDMEPMLRLSVGRYFKKINLDVSISADDVLHSSKPLYSSIGSDNYIQKNMRQRLGRNFSVNLSWTFGKFKELKDVSIETYDQ